MNNSQCSEVLLLESLLKGYQSLFESSLGGDFKSRDHGDPESHRLASSTLSFERKCASSCCHFFASSFKSSSALPISLIRLAIDQPFGLTKFVTH